jgi:hypothetical protein
VCSIAGFIAERPLTPIEVERLTQALLYHGAVRGDQSAGLYMNGQLFKKATDPQEFIYLPEYRALVEQPARYALIHTRMPTCGGRGDKQAQPFKHGDIVTVHNGMFHDCKSIRKKWNIKKKSGVDSELLTSFIESYGIARLPDFLEDAFGNAAVGVMVGERMYLMRTDNPISTMSIKLYDGNLLHVFASTTAILEAAVHHTWLMPASYRPATLTEGRLYEVTGKRLDAISEPIKAARRGWTREYTDYHDDAFHWGGSGTHHGYGPPPKSPHTTERSYGSATRTQSEIDSIWKKQMESAKNGEAVHLTKKERRQLRRVLSESIKSKEATTPNEKLPIDEKPENAA